MLQRGGVLLIYLRFKTRISWQEGHPDDHLQKTEKKKVNKIF